MSYKRKWIFLVLIFTVSLSVVGGAFIMWRRLTVDSGQAVQPSQTADVSTTRRDATPTAAPLSDESALGDIQITPLDFTDQGVTLDSPFLIQSKKRMDRFELENCLFIKTGELFSISDSSDTAGAFELNFTEPLSENRVYNIVYAPEGKRPASFAFQTEPGAAPPNLGYSSDNGYDAELSDSRVKDISLYDGV
ncbi:MAG: hypothetical protein LBB94_01160, partial [Clostridiales bacterium]|nr:hypothetical protein [Clostridiales bacterium]